MAGFISEKWGGKKRIYVNQFGALTVWQREKSLDIF
jgi:hypothetical protein